MGECCHHCRPCACERVCLCECVTRSGWGQGWCTFNLLSVSRPLQGLWHIASVSIIHERPESFKCVRAAAFVWNCPSKAYRGSKLFWILYAVIISTLLHNHTIYTAYKLTLTHRHTVLPLQLHNPWILGIEWPGFISSLLPTGSCAVDEVITWGGPQAQTGHNVGPHQYKPTVWEKNDSQGQP